MVDAFATFRFFNLLRFPVITTQGPESYPLHRTSLWTQLYGRAHLVHFDQWPPAWKNQNPGIFWLARAIFVLALLPTALAWVGAFRFSAMLVRSVRFPGQTALDSWIVIIAALGWLGFVVLYSMQYRDFSVMKFIFVLPGITSWAAFLCMGFDWTADLLSKTLWRRTLALACAGLCGLYCVDVIWLIVQLA